MSKNIYGNDVETRRVSRNCKRNSGPQKAPVALANVQAQTRGSIIKTHASSVTFPDGVQGECKYERKAPHMA